MPDKKLTDSEIVKALECCVSDDNNHNDLDECKGCPYIECRDCTNDLRKETLNLINRLQAENERLKNEYEECSKRNVDLMGAFKSYKAETYKEFAEWLYSLFPTENSEIVVISRTGIVKKVNELLDQRSD